MAPLGPIAAGLTLVRPLLSNSGKVPQGRRGHSHRQDLQAEHALNHKEVQPREQPPQTRIRIHIHIGIRTHIHKHKYSFKYSFFPVPLIMNVTVW